MADKRDKPYLILISIDGFRWDYQDLYETPAMDRIAEIGVRAEALVPVFPTLTFPNHYSIATGLYPANHGLVGNRFPSKDRRSFYSLSDRESPDAGLGRSTRLLGRRPRTGVRGDPDAEPALRGAYATR